MIEDVDQETPFLVDISEQGGTVTVAPSGELDLTTMPQMERSITPLRPAERLVLDLRGLDFMDSTGVRLVMELDLRSRAEGWELVIVRGTGVVAHLLDLCRIADRVRTVDDPTGAD
jgi:anti-sigma B factor antagonist